MRSSPSLLVLSFLVACSGSQGPGPDGGLSPDGGTGLRDGGATSDAGGTCNAPLMTCGGACVDPSTSAANCGACGHACAAGQGCSSGACVSLPSNCSQSPCPTGFYCDLSSDTCLSGCTGDPQCASGVCNIGNHSCCGAGQQVCSGACTDTSSDRDNCGSCGNVCPSTAGGQPVCSQGQCAQSCQGRLTACQGQCVDTTSNVNDCGACGHACPVPNGGTVACTNGACVPSCPSNLTYCSNVGFTGGCVDLQSDVDDCGACANVCTTTSGGTAVCSMGSCGFMCSATQTQCGTTCEDTQTDVNNCGSCGNVCPSPGVYGSATCSSGTCGVACSILDCGGECCAPNSYCCTAVGPLGTYEYCQTNGQGC